VKCSIKKGDTVYVLWGGDRADRLEDVAEEQLRRMTPAQLKQAAERSPGKRGKVISVLREQGKVVVDGVNMLTKHARPRGMPGRAAQMQTGRIQEPGAIPIAKVMLVCPRCDKPTKARRRMVEGKKVRVCRRCGEVVDQV
jgi:large subunit ribosomal protein L24